MKDKDSKEKEEKSIYQKRSEEIFGYSSRFLLREKIMEYEQELLPLIKEK